MTKIAGDEIDVLDPAGYGAVTITKTISIVNDGAGVAAIAVAIGASSGNAITINAGASDRVHLRGLTIDGRGLNGIQFNTGGNLAIENCVVRNFTTGINIVPSTSSSFSVSNTIASNNIPGNGIDIARIGSAVVTGVLSEVITNNNIVGIGVNGSSTTGASLNVTIVDSEAFNNPDLGVWRSRRPAMRPPPSCCAIPLPAITVPDLWRRGVPFSGGGIIQSYGDNDRRQFEQQHGRSDRDPHALTKPTRPGRPCSRRHVSITRPPVKAPRRGSRP
jgi:hypothetical protein